MLVQAEKCGADADVFISEFDTTRIPRLVVG
jgi:hypothetical protein